ncbi:uncharacterized protein HMPREF1541_07107 [Cyphellophora europaea CBS 101466]|uniref:FAD-binding PCMH-type domain-containing protein n=1 Tax=Cyphellophora europaea (strain CBS 101466) TaxID=1220924 RepID=W2RME4_CYPE1|nr:uncharacterized protein HMPREF1541_07107 [Cyphellophora europaea CBS 101466]ETN37485.1 hypothetical protein HMPREF1541_07107 [Cyphellophora europaea CBS 101466]
MLFRASCLVAAFAFSSWAQVTEPANFNVTEALIEEGVDITELPLADLQSRSSNAACAVACASLDIIYSSNLFRDGEAAYDSFTDNYWAQQQSNVNPYCIFKAPDTKSVSVAILISRLTTCPFAAKSGGHAAFKGASNIEGGITISLENLDSIKVSSDKKTVAIGSGNRWARVYSELAKSDLAVIGGRVAPIGTGGLTTGGGISFFSGIYGWACDNVAAYDVILASGLTTTASPTQNPDLYWALRGGGNNFGIVHTFHYEAIELPGNAMWGGGRVYLEDQFAGLTKAFANLVANSPKDPNAGQWVAWLTNQGTKIASTELWYGNPNGGSAVIFNEYNNLTAISDTTGPKKLAAYATELDASNPYGLRETYYGLTVQADQALAEIAKDIFFEELPATANVAGANPVLLYQGITSGQIAAMRKNGGNPLGLTDPNKPLYLIHVACWWQNEADDATVYTMITKVLRRIKAEAKKRGKDSDYVYMNYASLYEDVIRSYGKANQQRLQSIGKKYDPQAVFQKLQPGYFKLHKAPVTGSPYFTGQ